MCAQRIGIDLGTTFSAMASLDAAGHPVMIPNSEGEVTTPSVIYFDQSEIMIGAAAKNMQTLGETNIACFFKRAMGDPHFQLHLGGREYNSVSLSALLLKKLKADAEAALGQAVHEAVITVPAYFNDRQRKATLQAGQEAGLKVLQIVNEPTAAAIAYGLKQTAQSQCILVYDLGGGTFDVTLLRITPQALEVLATDGDHQLGGKDWDDRIAHYVAQQFIEEFHCDPLEDHTSFYELLGRCETAKRQLSALEQTRIALTHAGKKGHYTLTRTQFVHITQDLMQRTQLLCEQVLRAADLSWSQIDATVLVGGSTRMPMVKAFLTQMTEKAPMGGINPDEAVALGAAILAQSSSAEAMQRPVFTLGSKRIEIQDVMSHSLGMVAENADRSRYLNSIILPKNQPIPSCQTRPFQLRTSARQANALEVYLLQGESERPLDCHVLGKYVFSGITHVVGQPAVIQVEYTYDRNGVIQISATQKQPAQALKLDIEAVPQDLSWLDQAPQAKASLAHLSVLVAVDLSGSMSDTPLRKAQEAANQFVAELDLSHTSMALLVFADRVKISQPLTQNAKALQQGVKSWTIGQVGIGNRTDPFREALELLQRQENPRFLIVLTDGVWSDQARAIQRAKACAEAGIEIIAIGFGGADQAFLRQIATSDEQALFTDLGRLSESFSRIAQVLTETGGGLNMPFRS